jgi:hypothetical protein
MPQNRQPPCLSAENRRRRHTVLKRSVGQTVVSALPNVRAVLTYLVMLALPDGFWPPMARNQSRPPFILAQLSSTRGPFDRAFCPVTAALWGRKTRMMVTPANWSDSEPFKRTIGDRFLDPAIP